MNLLLYLSDYMIPFIIFYIVGFGILMKVNVYDDFVDGAKDGFMVVVNILPTLVGLMIAVGILRASGALDLLSNILSPIVRLFHFPAELVPLITIKMFSSSAATSLLLDLFKEYGADSNLGRLASIIMSCTETIFYTMSVYFLTVKVKKTRYTLWGALCATLTGVIASSIIVKYM